MPLAHRVSEPVLTVEGLFLLYYTQGVPLLFPEEVNCIGELIDIISGVE